MNRTRRQYESEMRIQRISDVEDCIRTTDTYIVLADVEIRRLGRLHDLELRQDERVACDAQHQSFALVEDHASWPEADCQGHDSAGRDRLATIMVVVRLIDGRPLFVISDAVRSSQYAGRTKELIYVDVQSIASIVAVSRWEVSMPKQISAGVHLAQLNANIQVVVLFARNPDLQAWISSNLSI